MNALLLVASLAVQTGELKLKIEGKAGEVVVYPATPVVETRLFAHQCESGFFLEPSGLAPATSSDAGAGITLKPGSYHVRIRTDGDDSIRAKTCVWLTNQKVEAGKTLEAVVKLGPTGAVKGSWSVDKRKAQGGKPLERCTAALIRDGRVWAFATCPKGGGIDIKGVAPGIYSLLLIETYEIFAWVTDNVIVTEGKETEVKVEVKRANLGGLRIQFTEQSGKPVGLPEGTLLMEPKGRFALGPTVVDSTDGVDSFVWPGLPSGGGYVLQGQGIEKVTVTLKAPAIKGTGAFAEEIYETLKVPVRSK